jgi:glycosyltransferase involved in cell wall biosynthesis
VPNELGFAFSVRNRLEELQAASPVDFVLCHGYTLTSVVGRYFGRKFGVRFGMFMHGHIFTRPRGTYDARLTAFYKWIAPRCYRETDLIFALSPEQKRLAVNAGADVDKVVLSPNGVDPEDIGIVRNRAFDDRRSSSTNGTFNLLYVGRLSIEKGVESLLEACGILKEWKVDFFLTLVGDGPDREELSNLAVRLELSDRVTFVSALPRQSLGSLYQSSDLLCVPSLDEPLGNVVLEGLSGGCLVLGSDVGGIPFILTDGVDGYLVPPGRPDKMAEKIRYASANRDKAELIQRNALEMVRRRFNWDDIVQRMHGAIRETLTQQ